MKKADNLEKERRRFPRVMGPVFFRAPRISAKRRSVSNLSLGGVRIYCDERVDIGQSLELEFFLPNGTTVEVMARVVWVKKLPAESEALYDVGLEFMDLSENVVEELRTVLK